MNKRDFRKMRGLDDRTLGAALTNHADVLRGLAIAVEKMLRERKLLLVWGFLVTFGVIYAILCSHAPDNFLMWFQR